MELARLTSGADQSQAQFQNFMFLIRDWSNPSENSYGIVGGNSYLQKVLEIKQNQREELKNLRRELVRSFENLSCCLMPFPGTRVATGNNRSGAIKDIDQEFMEILLEVIPKFASPDNLAPVRIGGIYSTAAEYFKNIENYIMGVHRETLNISKVGSLLQENVRMNSDLKIMDSVKSYEKEFGWIKLFSLASLDALENLHEEVKSKAIDFYKKNFRFGDKDENSARELELSVQIDLIFHKNKYFVELILKNRKFLMNCIKVGGTACGIAAAIAFAIFKIK